MLLLKNDERASYAIHAKKYRISPGKKEQALIKELVLNSINA